ncbi:MAG: DUF5131 family protein [Myxococcota bacterium]
MGNETGIEWTDHTFNPVWGCTKISPGCTNCYAETFDKRIGGDHWKGHAGGVGYRTFGEAHWKEPMKWQAEAAAAGRRDLVFCASMADWADSNGPASERAKLWALIRQTPNLVWQLLTKRADNIVRFLPPDWGSGYANVWLGVTVEDRKYGLPRVDVLRRIPAAVRFLSVEPLLESVKGINLEGIHWVITGGESGPRCRPMAAEWVREVHEATRRQGVAHFFKQYGHVRNNPLYELATGGHREREAQVARLDPHGKGGSKLDGQMWREFPRGWSRGTQLQWLEQPEPAAVPA